MEQGFDVVQQESSDSLWQKMQGESLFITGGSGLFGYWFLRSLVEANRRLGTDIKVTVLSRNPEAFMQAAPELFSDGWIDLIKGNVVDFTFPSSPYSRILHLAMTSAKETFYGEDQLAKFKMLLNGTERVLQFASVCGAQKVLFTSSGVVYGACPESIYHIPETYQGAPDTVDPSTAAGQAKRAAEYLCGYYANKHNFNFTIARCFSFVGPRIPVDLHYAIGNFIRDAIISEKIIVKGDGSPVRSYLYMGDLVVWLLALFVNGTSSQVYNVGSDQAVSVKDLAFLVRDLLCPEKNVEVEGDTSHNIGNFGRNYYIPDITKAKNELNLDVWTPLDQSIIKTAQYVIAMLTRVRNNSRSG